MSRVRSKAKPKKAPANRRASPKGGRQPGLVPLGDGVIGVAKHPRGFQIRYVKRGKRITAYRKHEDAANEFAARMHAQLLADEATREAGDQPDSAGGPGAGAERPTLDGWHETLWRLTQLVEAHPRDEDYQRALKAAASGATAAAKLRDRAEEERTLVRVEKKIDLARKRRAAKQVEQVAKHHQQSGADRTSQSVH